jgi:hypothetical protein
MLRREARKQVMLFGAAVCAITAWLRALAAAEASLESAQ